MSSSFLLPFNVTCTLAALLLGVVIRPVDAAGKCDGYTNMIAEGGSMWASLGNADPKSTNKWDPNTPHCPTCITIQCYQHSSYCNSLGTCCVTGCEDKLMAIRGTGWIISPDNAASIAICKKFGFGTICLTMSNGKCYRTATQGSAGNLWGSGVLATSGDKYKVKYCQSRVLLQCPCPVASYCVIGHHRVRMSQGGLQCVLCNQHLRNCRYL